MVARFYGLDYWPSTRGREFSEDGTPPENAIVDQKTGKYICNEFGEFAVYTKARLEMVLEGEDGDLYYFDIMSTIRSYDPKFRATERRRTEMADFFEKWDEYRIDEDDNYRPIGLYNAVAAYMMS